MKQKLIRAYDSMEWFTDHEAWTIFKLAAFTEAIGWTLLITGVLFRYYSWPNHETILLLAGRLHGVFFLIYIMSVFAVSKSLRLSKLQFTLAALVSIPPYGTLVYEQWVARGRRRDASAANRQITVRAIIAHKNKLLLMQPRDQVYWCLPGGKVNQMETPEQALRRVIHELTGSQPQIGKLQYVGNYQHHDLQRLEFFFTVTNANDFLDLNAPHHPEVDEMRFLKPDSVELLPTFLRQKLTTDGVEFITY